jgi:hypothetical protein
MGTELSSGTETDLSFRYWDKFLPECGNRDTAAGTTREFGQTLLDGAERTVIPVSTQLSAIQ